MKIISYSLWGNNPRYYQPLLENIVKAKELFPGWFIHVYASDSLDQNIANQITTHGASIFRCGESPDSRGMFWRYRALKCQGVSVVLIRDADSELTLRDKLMVDAWMNTGFDFYVTRDHPSHVRPMIGGCWGVRGEGISKIREIADYNPIYAKYGDDEKFLTRWVYLRFRNQFMVYSDFLTYKGEALSRCEVPRESPSDFIGRVKLEDNTEADRVLSEYIKSKKFKVRYLIPYSLPWRIVRYVLVLLRIRKDDWRPFDDFKPLI